MTDEIQLLRDARPVVRGPLPAVRDERRSRLLATIASPPRERRFARRSLALALPAAIAIAAAALIAASEPRGEQAWAAAVVEVAEASPRLLITAPGWKVTRADEFTGAIGEMTFSDGRRQAELHWQPADQHAATVVDRAHSADISTSASVLAAPARVFRYDGTDDYTALWVAGAHALELRGRAPDLTAFTALLASLEKVDVDTWLSAMPASVVLPASRAEVVREMLADIPVPRGFDAGRLGRGDAVRDRYQLGAMVTGAVACAWIDQWIAAKRSGDDAAGAEAVAAMATSRRWRVLRQMEPEGGYPRAIREYADAIAGSGTVVGGKVLTVEESYRTALGCEAG